MSPNLKYLTSLPALDADFVYSSAIDAQKLSLSVVPRITRIFLPIKLSASLCDYILDAMTAIDAGMCLKVSKKVAADQKSGAEPILAK